MSFKKFPALYTLDSKKKVRIFECSVEQGMKVENDPDINSLDLVEGISICTSTGLLGGKLIKQTIFVKQGKNKGKTNETTPLSQALLQADSLWREKQEEGYKSIKIIAEKLNCNPEIITETEGWISEALKRVPQAAYTNSNWDELPMLAKKWKDIKVPSFPYFAQPKLNGVRCLVKWDKQKQVMRLISRGGSYYKLPRLEEQILKLMMELNEKMGKVDFLFDGEIYVHGIPLQEISGASRKEESGLFVSNTWLEYHIYDVINLENIKETQVQRHQTLCAVRAFNKQTHIKIVDTYTAENNERVSELHDRFVSEGYEGLILREEHAEYCFNERSKGLLKVKQYQDEEFEIIGCSIDTNKSIGESFCFTLKNNINDLTFNSRPTGTEEQKEEWYNNIIKYHRKKATVRFFERSKDGLPQQGSVQHKLTEVLHIRPKGE